MVEGTGTEAENVRNRGSEQNDRLGLRRRQSSSVVRVALGRGSRMHHACWLDLEKQIDPVEYFIKQVGL